jgi:3-oxoacyl-[acyl-carrier protein] reductase
MAEMKLDGKVVMMTGAGRGMGREMSIGLAGAGAKVAMIDIDKDVLHEAAELAEKAGGQGAALPMVADVTRADNAATAVRKTIDQYGRIDVLVNDAVVGPERIGPDFFNEKVRFWDLDDGLWRQMLDVNIFGPQLMARTVVPHMLEQPRRRSRRTRASWPRTWRAPASASTSCSRAGR